MFKQSYTYRDVGIVPTKQSFIASRDDIEVSTEFLDIELSLPVVIAPMKRVVGIEMAQAITKLGGQVILPRSEIDKDLKLLNNCPASSIPSIPARKGMSWYKPYYYQQGTPAVCIDVANGFCCYVKDLVKELKNANPNIKIVAGNVGSVEGYEFMHDIGVDAVRVGIGGGAGCSTSIATGIGVGQASLVREIADFKYMQLDGEGPLIIADGGIKEPRDLCIAIALGADVIMAGFIFAGCEESPGEVIKFNNKLFKQYAGEASFAIKKTNKYVEGEESLVAYSGPVEKTWQRYEEGLRSAMSYMNAKTIEDFKYLNDDNFRLMSSSASLERKPQG